VLWAGEAANAGVQLPVQLVVVLAVVASIAPFVTGWLGYRAATKNTQATRKTATETQAAQTNEAHRTLILHAIELVRSDDPFTREQGNAMLEGIAEMAGLSPDNALLIQKLTREAIERRLEQARRLGENEGRHPRFWIKVLQREKDEGR
jgi:hypothetical protein